MSGAVCRRLVLLSVLIIVGAPRNTAAQATCDRTCLAGVADAWFAAIVAHDPSKVPIAANARFTEQTQAMKIGENGWSDFLR